MNNENLEDYVIKFEDIDFGKLNETMASISEDIEKRKNLMTESEKEIYESADAIIELCDRVLEVRNQIAEDMDKMTEEESIAFYKNINEKADEYTDSLGIQGITVEELQKEISNEESDD